MAQNFMDLGPLVLRVVTGLLFFIPGRMKLLNPSMIIGFLGSLGFPAAAFFGWLVLLSELLFGGLVILGWKLRYTVWPLVIILGVATLTVVLPAMSGGPANLLFHLLGIAALISLFFSGAGRFSLE